MRTASTGRTAIALVAGTIAAAAMATGAQGATIHACVKPKSGVTRIVAAHAKCRRGEQKLSWSTAGPQGPAGKNGANGANGQPGAEGHPGVSGQGPVYFGETKELEGVTGEAPIVSKIVPPGSYSVKGSVLIVDSQKTPGHAAVLCGLEDQTGTEGSGVSESLDFAGWESPLAELGAASFGAAATIPLDGALSSKVTTRVELLCEDIAGSGGKLNAESAHVQALQVSSIL